MEVGVANLTHFSNFKKKLGAGPAQAPGCEHKCCLISEEVIHICKVVFKLVEFYC